MAKQEGGSGRPWKKRGGGQGNSQGKQTLLGLPPTVYRKLSEDEKKQLQGLRDTIAKK
jgi:hypothetical protein